ncbi:MAG: hypothetical protein HYV26_21775, partial [Candidatus Hydrogenedentes bacterium]|nr:hypothetical protein [Candidatus Hydrogenedentota bacterium]
MQQLPIIGHIGGSTTQFAVSDKLAVVQEGPLLRFLDLSDLAHPSPVGSLLFEGAHPFETAAVAFSGSYVYTTLGEDFTVINTSTPQDPDIVGSLPLAADFDNSCEAVIGQGFVVVAQYVMDVADVEHPSVAAALPFRVLQGEIVERYLYAAVHVPGENYKFKVVDISDLTSPYVISSIETILGVVAVAATDTHAYAGTQGGELFAIDVSNPSAPTYSAVPTPQCALYSDLEIEGDLLFCTSNCLGRIDVYDISSPYSPVFVTNTGQNNGEGHHFEIQNNVLFRSAGSKGLIINDISNLASVQVIGAYRPSFPSFYAQGIGEIGLLKNHIYGVWVEGNPAIANDGWFGSVDVTNPANPFEDLSVPLSSLGLNLDLEWLIPTGLEVQGDLVYSLLDLGDLIVWNADDPSTPQVVNTIDSPWQGNNVGASISISGNVACVTGVETSKGCVWILDAAGQVFQGGCLSGPFVAVETDGSYAYFVTRTSLIIVDITDPLDPIAISSVDGLSEVEDVGVGAGFAYVVCAAPTESVNIYDVTNPLNPTPVGSLTGLSLSPGSSIAVKPPYAYVAGGNLTVLDVSQPQFPQIVATASGQLGEVLVDKYAYVSGRAGLSVIPIPPPAPLVDPLPRYINADTLLVTGTADAGSFVTIGGGLTPVFQQLAPGAVAFSIVVPLKQEAVNTLSVTTMDGYGLVSLPTIRRVVEGDAFPAT